MNRQEIQYSADKETSEMKRIKNDVYQILSSLTACTIFISFGLMLGWPSPTYPHLLKPNATIPITIDQSAMIAGALKLGNFLATPLSTTRVLESKIALILSMSSILTGWIILAQLKSIYGLLLSRLFIGLGNGFGNGQMKIYFREVCNPNLAAFFSKYCVVFINVGVVLAFSVGGLLNYTYIAYCGIAMGTLFIILLVFVSRSPVHLLLQNRKEDASKALEKLRRFTDADRIDQMHLEACNSTEAKRMGLWDILKCSETRKNYLTLILLVFIQQYCGITPTTVYCQIIFRSSGCPNSQYCAVVFAVVYLISTAVGLKYSENRYKKHLLVASALLTSITIVAQISAVLFSLNTLYFSYTSLIIVNVFVVVYSIGLGPVPGYFLAERFPQPAKDVAGKTFVMCSFMFGLIATKVFQVLYASYGLFIPYCMFLISTSLGSVILMILPLFPDSGTGKVVDTKL